MCTDLLRLYHRDSFTRNLEALDGFDIGLQEHLIDFADELTFVLVIHKFMVAAVIAYGQNCGIVGAKSTNASGTSWYFNFTEAPF